MSFWGLNADNVNDYAYWENAFTDVECEHIIEYGLSGTLKKARTGDNTQLDTIRNSNVNFLEPNKDINYMYEKLTDITKSLNNQFFNFDLLGFGEGLQFTKYEAPTGHYTFHIDRSFNAQIRKLSIVLQLSDEDDYVGGDLELMFGDEPQKMIRKRGTILCFPSYVLHRVTPVTEGTRYSLVAWITGPQFK